MVNIGFLTSGRDERSYNMINKILKENGKNLDINVKFILSNIEEGEFKTLDKVFKLGKENQIDNVIVSSYEFERNVRKKDLDLWKRKFDKRISYSLESYNVDFLVTVGYDFEPSEYLCNKYNIINIRPSIPKGPVGTIDEIIEKTIKTKNRVGGVMTHAVNNKNQEQAIMYASFLLSDNRNSDSIRKQITKREPEVLFYTLKAFSEGLLEMKNHKVFIDDEFLFDPIALTGKVR